MCEQVTSNYGEIVLVKTMWWGIYQQLGVFIPGHPPFLFRLLAHKAEDLTLGLVFNFPMLPLTFGAAVRCSPAARTFLECMRVIARSSAGPAHAAGK